MFLDNFHGLFHVLSYNSDVSSIVIRRNSFVWLRTSAWTPVLFSFAGAIMTALLFLAEKITSSRTAAPTTKVSSPLFTSSWRKVCTSIGLFALQYFVSGLLDYALFSHTTTSSTGTSLMNFLHHTLSLPRIHLVLALLMVGNLVYSGFHRYIAGMVLVLSTSLAGPAVEYLLIHHGASVAPWFTWLYKYNNADWNGLCSWIPWVYAAGAPAVGLLALRLRQIQQT